MGREDVRQLIRGGTLIASLAVLAAIPSASVAQEPEPTLLKVEVGDSIGLPLPDAAVEAFDFFEGGIFREWAPVDPRSLPAGIYLLRFSHPGYRPTVFSVPLRTGSVVSLRVRLSPQRDSTPRRAQDVSATLVSAIGVAIDGRAKADIIGIRRVISAEDVAAHSDAPTFSDLMHRVRNTELRVDPGPGGSFRVSARGRSRRVACAPQVMINGDRRQFLPFAAFDGLYRPRDLEVLEIFPENSRVPLGYQSQRPGCGILVAWLKNG